ncbi:GFA family protein [Methylobacterium sp. J-070]|nr:GFA family protein [Methylobacterium sp. J-070]
MMPEDAVSVTGNPKVYNSSEDGWRSFCGLCGTGLFFTNALLKKMGMMQVRIAALDDPDAIIPQIQVQTAERVKWMTSAHELPAFERFPG